MNNFIIRKDLLVVKALRQIKSGVLGIKGVLLNVWDKAKSFLIKAGTVIFVSSALLWFL